jgi:L-iditol 2-dehydrogenase
MSLSSLNPHLSPLLSVDFYSVPTLDGTLTRYHVHPAGWLHKVPDTLTYPEIACLEPLSVCLHGTELVGMRLGQPVLITGAGPIGAVQLLVARAAGASPIVITDLQQDRLDFAKTLVPNVVTYKVQLDKTPEQSAKDLIKLFTEAGGNTEEIRPQIAMECTGVESSVATCAYSVNPGGKIMVIGVGKHHQSIPFMQ